MLKQKAIKLGVIMAGITLTTALLVGCEKEPDIVTTIHVSPTSFQTDVTDVTEIPYEPSDLKTQTNDALSDAKDSITEALKEDPETYNDIMNGYLESTCKKVEVVRVVDGDTYVVNLDGEETKIRLIGVDTPESVASQEYLDKTGKENTEEGKDISAIMKEKLPAGTTLFLEFDVNMYDKYNRVLAYAYFEDGEMVQEFLLKNGYAKVMTIEPNVAHSERFVELEQKAMNQGVGMWEGYEDLFEEQER